MLLGLILSGIINLDQRYDLHARWEAFCERNLIADEPWEGYNDGLPDPRREQEKDETMEPGE